LINREKLLDVKGREKNLNWLKIRNIHLFSACWWLFTYRSNVFKEVKRFNGTQSKL
jgi:hypothetical protein